MTAPLILGTNSIKDEGYEVANSLRFNDGDTDYLNKTLSSSPTNRRKFTFSTWVKRGELGDYQTLIGADVGSGLRDTIRFNNNDVIHIFFNEVSGASLITNRVFRDPSAWYNIILAVDTTQGTASNRIKLYVNGVQETSFSTSNYPSQNYDTSMNYSVVHNIGKDFLYSELFDGYMAETVFIDGQQLDATSFGEFDEDSNIWKPKDVSELTFGNNGFYLDFEDSSALGNDVSGNNNDFTVNNLTSIDQTTDTCTNNFATLNALHKVDDWSLAEGNLKFTNNSTGHRMTNSNIAVSQGKWYCEVKMTTEAQQTRVGVIDPDKFLYNTYIHNSGRGYAYKADDGSTRFNNGTTDANYGDTYTTGDIIGIAMDLDNHKLYFSKNGTFQDSGDPTSGATGTGSAFDLATGVFYSFGASTQDQGTDPVIEFNFGNPPFSISSGNSDGNGYGNFEYSVPSGYYALNSKNLAEYG